MSATLAKRTRTFLPADFTVTTWDALKPHYDRLLAWHPTDAADLERWLHAADELQTILQEDLGWRYIRMTCNTADEAATQAYQYFLEHISPNAQPLDHELSLAYYNSPYRKELDPQRYFIINRSVANQIELFRAENVPLHSQIGLKAQQYGATTGAMTVEHEGQTFTLQQAARFLERTDRTVREEVWRKVAARRTQDVPALDALFDELLALRTQVARNAGFDSYVDYKFRELGRFDYGREECLAFHQAIETAIVPLVDEILAVRQQRLGLSELRPWDLSVDTFGTEPLHPFQTGKELAETGTAILHDLSPELGSVLETLAQMGHLDLDSRVGKAPGGYNYPLYETGVPFIFMNAVGTQRDVTTLVHEAGHAIHSMVTRELDFAQDKDTPSEVAELASMSMELMSMSGWQRFYPNPADLRRAQLQQIIGTVTILPWIATIDAFQFWLYDHPGHTVAQRQAAWHALEDRFGGKLVNWAGLEDVRASLWQRQLHLFEVPFYYIEYGIAQLGALQVWQRYLSDPASALSGYLAALRLGNTRPIGQVYAAAGIEFNFSETMLRNLAAFVKGQLAERGFFESNK